MGALYWKDWSIDFLRVNYKFCLSKIKKEKVDYGGLVMFEGDESSLWCEAKNEGFSDIWFEKEMTVKTNLG